QDNILGVGLGLLAVLTHQTSRPQTQELVLANIDFELQFLVVLEFLLERFFAIVKRGHGRSGWALPAVYSGAAALFPPRPTGARAAAPRGGNHAMPLQDLSKWAGRSRTMEDLAAPFPVRALSATLDEADPDPRSGDPLPPLWHWLYFLEV